MGRSYHGRAVGATVRRPGRSGGWHRLHLSEPELLLYEPQADGSFRLVAVEYIVPRPSWTAPRPPSLFGRPFHNT
jgi:hypothetical protein